MRPDGLAVSLAGFPGASTALVELALTTRRLQAVTVQRADPRGREIRFVASLVAADRPRLLVLGGWSAAYAPLIRAAHRHHVPVAVYWTSTAGQTEVGRELDRLGAVIDDPRIRYRWFASRPLADAMTGITAGVAWLPVVLRSTRRPMRRRPWRHEGVANVSLFCSPHEYARKNVLNTLLGLARSRVPVRLHLNGLSADRHYRRVLDRLDVPWTDHGWMARDIYLGTVAGLDLGLQVSLAESFNYVAADHLLAGVPVVASPMVPVVADLPPAIAARFVEPRPDDPQAIARRVRDLLEHPRRTASDTSRARTSLIRSLRRREKMAACVLSGALDRA